MTRRTLTTALAAVLLLGLVTGCGLFGGGDVVVDYPGRTDIPYSVGDRFTINSTSDSDDLKRYRHVVCEVTLEVNDAAIIRTFDERLHRIREIVTEAISSKTLDQLRTSTQKDALREEIMDRVNEEFNTTAVRRVVFSEFFFA
jgi:flagellar basal body-associated protein FliL